MKAHSSTAGFAAALAPEMRARGDAAAGGGDCRWALLKTQEAQGALFKCFLLLAYSLLAAPRVATVAALFFVISMPLLAVQNLHGVQSSRAAEVKN